MKFVSNQQIEVRKGVIRFKRGVWSNVQNIELKRKTKLSVCLVNYINTSAVCMLKDYIIALLKKKT